MKWKKENKKQKSLLEIKFSESAAYFMQALWDERYDLNMLSATDCVPLPPLFKTTYRL